MSMCIRLARVAPVVLMCLATPAWGIVIDDFAAGPMSLEVEYGQPGQGSTQTGLPTAQVIGGVRDVAFNVIKRPGSTPPPGAGVRVAVETTGGGSFRYDADADLTAANFGLLYDGSATSTPAMNADLTADGHDALVLDFLYAEFASGAGFLDITLHSAGGGQRYDYLRVANSAGPFTLYVPFSPTSSPYSNTLDPQQVIRIMIGSSNGNLPGSFALSGIRTAVIPEPGAIGCLTFAAGVMLLRRRRA